MPKAAEEVKDEPEVPAPKSKSKLVRAYRSNCTCGESMARERGPDGKGTGNWSCIRILSDNDPRPTCQENVKAAKILEVPPPPKKADRFDD